MNWLILSFNFGIKTFPHFWGKPFGQICPKVKADQNPIVGSDLLL